MTVDEIYTLSSSELDASISEMMGVPVVCHDWPCGHTPDGGYEAALRDDDITTSWWNERRPVYAPDASLWPPKPLFPEDPDSITYCYVVPVPRYSTDIAAAWEVFLYVMELDRTIQTRFYDWMQWMTRPQERFSVPAEWPYVLTELRYDMPKAICRAALIACQGEKGTPEK